MPYPVWNPFYVTRMLYLPNSAFLKLLPDFKLAAHSRSWSEAPQVYISKSSEKGSITFHGKTHLL